MSGRPRYSVRFSESGPKPGQRLWKCWTSPSSGEAKKPIFHDIEILWSRHFLFWHSDCNVLLSVGPHQSRNPATNVGGQRVMRRRGLLAQMDVYDLIDTTLYVNGGLNCT